jgi:hypothetical protein
VRALAARTDRRGPKVGRGNSSRREGCGMGSCEGGERLRFVRSRLAPEVEGTDDDREAMNEGEC